MDIIVCIKQVPETADVSWDPETGVLRREGIPGVVNPTDKNALEAALQLKERHGGVITALSMGPPQAEEALREALSMGVDRGVLLSDRQFAGADTWATSYTLGLAVKRIASFDLILCGKESADGMTAHVGPQLAEFLNLPQLTYATAIDIHGHSLEIRQKVEHGYRMLRSPLPALVTVEREMNQPRIPPMDQIMEAFQKEVLRWDAEALGGEDESFGLKGSPTQTKKVYTKRLKKGKAQFLEGEPVEKVQQLVQILKDQNFIAS
ncbi:MAG: electron transfer flavoprotein subunit beta/FixA family protein [Desulfobacteraceae bacterium]|jgi:electron transfer flavoprotein beta subunit